jgi:hypothetical protein
MKTVQIKDDIHKRLKMCSVISGNSITELVNEGIIMVLKNYEDADITIVRKDKIIKEYFNK